MLSTVAPCHPGVGRQQQADPWGALANQSGLIEEPQAKERPCLEEGWTALLRKTLEVALWSLHTCAYMYVCTLL